ncbi:class I SAM-dependent methyltransferase [Sphingobacterium sp. BIGb0165]|uniref:class I SAM-dependent methyltransferase n=1 Tax=Sphingobacterium sp. BIGb0165 TaxID=2940615 RepID=UPI002166E665|nr:class I SAM-dependent methyltransferase [Sphingobacterium sp. BIGb0165]MCS4225331.1 ubiquinone/menaquinone biosynthesis C-methylase UbiE [Sphingobacterium sp. BIGb0165]
MIINRITSYWDKQSKIWREEKEEAWSQPETANWLNFFEEILLDPKLGGKNILEIGTASGYFGNIMTKAGFAVTAIDLSPNMINEAKQVSDALNLTVDYHVMDAQNLAFDDDKFDLVFTRLMTWTIPDLFKCYSEIFRVLKPGGMFINFDGDFGATVFSQEGHERYPKEIMEEANAIKSNLDISKHSRPERDLYLLDKVGFVDLKTDNEVHNKIYSKSEEEGGLFMLSGVKPMR